MLDNLRIPEIGYSADFEANDCGWKPEGFVRIKNLLSQTFLVSLIDPNDTQNPIRKFQVADGERLTLNFEASSSESGVTLVISGSSRYSRQPANYWVAFTQN
jgi:hypothetical protein